MRFDPKLGHGTCKINRINLSCTQCTSTLYKPWTPGVPPYFKLLYQPVKYCTYWPVLGSFNNLNISVCMGVIDYHISSKFCVSSRFGLARSYLV